MYPPPLSDLVPGEAILMAACMCSSPTLISPTLALWIKLPQFIQKCKAKYKDPRVAVDSE